MEHFLFGGINLEGSLFGASGNKNKSQSVTSRKEQDSLYDNRPLLINFNVRLLGECHQLVLKIMTEQDKNTLFEKLSLIDLESIHRGNEKITPVLLKFIEGYKKKYTTTSRTGIDGKIQELYSKLKVKAGL